jgi:hypothetical protein
MIIKPAGLSEFISQNPAAPILAGGTLGTIAPYIIGELLENKPDKYKYKLWHSLLGGLGGTGLGALGTYLGTEPEAILKGSAMHPVLFDLLEGFVKSSDLNDVESKAINDMGSEVLVDGKKIDIKSLAEITERKQKHGDDIAGETVPTISVESPIPSLYKDTDVEPEMITGPESDLSNVAPGEEEVAMEILKESMRHYISGAVEELNKIGITKEADQELFINEMLGVS